MAIDNVVTGIADFECRIGATFSRQITWESGGTPVPLTGYTGKMQVRSDDDSATVVVTFTTSDTTMTLGGVAGTITLLLSAATTAALAAGVYVYDLILTAGTGEVYPILRGQFIVRQRITT